MTKHSKEVLREFQMFPSRVDDRPTAYLQPPTAIPGAGATGGTLRPGKGIAGLAAAGLALLSGKGKTTIPPGTGGPRRGGGFGGRGGKPTPPGTGGGSGSEKGFVRRNIDKLVLGVVGAVGGAVGLAIGIVEAGKRIFKEIEKVLHNIIDLMPLKKEHKEWLKANTMVVVIGIAAVAGTAEAARRATPRIMKVLRNRRISAEISKALDAGDETLARTILLDAIEDENINLTAIRRKLGDDDYERLYRDYL